jgi:hypothetical protein
LIRELAPLPPQVGQDDEAANSHLLAFDGQILGPACRYDFATFSFGGTSLDEDGVQASRHRADHVGIKLIADRGHSVMLAQSEPAATLVIALR